MSGLPSLNPHFYVSPEFVGRLDALLLMDKLYTQCDRRGRLWLTRIIRQVRQSKEYKGAE